MADLTGKTIAELPLDSAVSGSEAVPVMDGSSSKRVPLSSLFIMDDGTSASGLNIDELLSPGTYYVNYLNQVTGTQPTTSYYYKLVVMKIRYATDSKVLQIAYLQNPNCSEYRRVYDGTSWTSWTRTANANDLSSIASQFALLGGVKFSPFNVAANNSADVDITSSTHGVIFFVNSATQGGGCGMYAFTCSSEGAVVVNALVEASSLTLTVDTNLITVASTSGFTVYGVVMTY